MAKQPALFSSNRIETEADRQAAGEGFVFCCTFLVLSGNKNKKTIIQAEPFEHPIQTN